MSESPPPTGLPARVAALKSLKEAAADRRRSLPVQQTTSHTSTPRKRRKSEHIPENTSHPVRKSSRNAGQISTITVESEDEVSDTDSEPLSDAPSESASESASRPIEAIPSPTPSTGSCITVASNPNVANRKPTRASTRTQPSRRRPSPSRDATRTALPVAAPSPPSNPALKVNDDIEVSSLSC
jgi:hypothetical protein